MQERRAFLVVFAIAAALIIPAALTLRTVVHPVILQATSDNPTPLGYTWSLLLFIIPIGALGWWFARRPDLQFPRKAFWRTIAVLTPLGFLLDLLFGNAFFVFPNKSATLGWEIPAVDGRVDSIKKDTVEKNSFGRVRRGSAGLNKLAKQLDGGAAVCSDPRSGLRSLRRLVQ